MTIVVTPGSHFHTSNSPKVSIDEQPASAYRHPQLFW